MPDCVAGRSCGTSAGYTAGCRHPEGRSARATYNKLLYARQRRSGPQLIDAEPIRRAIRSAKDADISLGRLARRSQTSRQHLYRLLKPEAKRVQRRVAERIAAALLDEIEARRRRLNDAAVATRDIGDTPAPRRHDGKRLREYVEGRGGVGSLRLDEHERRDIYRVMSKASLSDEQADRWAVRLGQHPSAIWTDWFDLQD
jgi:hypothetical protein